MSYKQNSWSCFVHLIRLSSIIKLFASLMLLTVSANVFATGIYFTYFSCPGNSNKSFSINGFTVSTLYQTSPQASVILNKQSAIYYPFVSLVVANGSTLPGGLGSSTLYQNIWDVLSVNSPGVTPQQIGAATFIFSPSYNIVSGTSFCSTCVDDALYATYRNNGMVMESAASGGWPFDVKIPITCTDSTRSCIFNVPSTQNFYVHNYSAC